MFFRCTLLLPLFVLISLLSGLSQSALADNNIEFLDKEIINRLNSGIYEVVTPKKENENIKYARELPFERLDFVERNEKYHSIGTAFFINDTELMTAAHVFHLEYFSLFHDFYIRSPDGTVYPVNSIKRYSTHRDMAVFDLQHYPAAAHPLTFSQEVAIGDTVFSVGNAQGEGIAYRAGQIASFTPEREYGKWHDIRFTSPASPGNSGGPLLNLKGEVVGLIVKKNESENYNISVPIAELENLTDEAEFHIRNTSLGLLGVDDTLTRDWSCSIPLPAPVGKVAQQAQESLDTHMRKLGDDLQESVKEKNFPRGARYRSYLRDQRFIKGFAILLPETNFNKWSVRSSYTEKIPISATQNVFRGSSHISDLHAIVEKPENLSLEDFLDSPKAMMDSLLKAVSINRQVGSENVPVTSFGEPERSEHIQDALGRTWISSLWNLPYSNSYIYSSCLPYPKGVICNIDNKGSAYRKYGYFHDIHDGYNEIVVGYAGEVDDWVEFFGLDKKYLPKLFHNSQLAIANNALQVKLNDYSLELNHPGITGKSDIHFHLGYANKQLLAEDILAFEVFPEKGGKSRYRIQPYHEPTLFNSDSYKSTWKDIIEGAGDFSGKAINGGDTISIKKPIPETMKTFLAPDKTEITEIFTASCQYKASDTGVEEDCNGFLDGITVH